jgi:alkyl sulfatase BDS1-like metallo-beta-lactamase superfamily hydrolase
LHNGVPNGTYNLQAKKPDATLDISQADLLAFAFGTSSLDELVSTGKARTTGDRMAVDKLCAIGRRVLETDSEPV